MWRPWSRPLEILGRLRVPVPFRRRVRVGSPRSVDAEGGMDWRAFQTAEELFRVWGPVPESPWEPFHCVPLFAVLDRIPRDRVGPRGRERVRGQRDGGPVPAHARLGASAPSWLEEGTWTILDLPGPSSVVAAVRLIEAGGCQPVCTFDNWPHPRGILSPEEILAELLHWSPVVARARLHLGREAPPLWICDSERLGLRQGRPGEFDNRYFLDDSVLPGPGLLSRSGIRRVVYVTLWEEGARGGSGDLPLRDLEAYLSDLLRAGFSVEHVALTDPEERLGPLASPRTPRRPPRSGFRRSAAGGFGTSVPEPSSGSGG
jgi:hypothetical protein